MKASVTTALIQLVLLPSILSQNNDKGTVSGTQESEGNANGSENVKETAALNNINQNAPKTESFTPNTECTPVSVQHHATYCVVGNVCSGTQGNPETMACPKRGAKAVGDCQGGEDNCTLQQDSHCIMLSTGVFGCSVEGAEGASLGNEAADVPCPLPGWNTKQTPCPSLPQPCPTLPQPCPTLPQPTLEKGSTGGIPCASMPMKESDQPGSEPSVLQPCPPLPIKEMSPPPIEQVISPPAPIPPPEETPPPPPAPIPPPEEIPSPPLPTYPSGSGEVPISKSSDQLPYPPEPTVSPTPESEITKSPPQEPSTEPLPCPELPLKESLPCPELPLKEPLPCPELPLKEAETPAATPCPELLMKEPEAAAGTPCPTLIQPDDVSPSKLPQQRPLESESTPLNEKSKADDTSKTESESKGNEDPSKSPRQISLKNGSSKPTPSIIYPLVGATTALGAIIVVALILYKKKRSNMDSPRSNELAHLSTPL